MNKIIDTFLLSGDIFVSKMHVRQPRYTYSACGPFTKHQERIQKIREIGSLKHISKIN